MARFLARRTLQGLIVIWLVTVIVFLIFYVGPGSADVARALAGSTASPETGALISHRLLLGSSKTAIAFAHARTRDRRIVPGDVSTSAL
jgi:ABC-type dipeptide/oligopeptide/nickel transport system permease component